jgi:NADH-quinone oxidoreductase subunit J
MPDSLNAVAFVLLAAAVLIGALRVVTTRNVVHAAFWMLETLVALAGVYLLLSAEFVALVQLMVYAGAVAVLLIFAVMLTLRRREDARRSRDFSWTALVASVALLGGIGAALVGYAPAVTAFPEKTPGVLELGRVLFTAYALPFEIASLVLLVALVGAVWWAYGDGTGEA